MRRAGERVEAMPLAFRLTRGAGGEVDRRRGLGSGPARRDRGAVGLRLSDRHGQVVPLHRAPAGQLVQRAAELRSSESSRRGLCLGHLRFSEKPLTQTELALVR